jgi:hypothetical protein
VDAGLRRTQTTTGGAGRNPAYNTGMRDSARLAGSPPEPRLASTPLVKHRLARYLGADESGWDRRFREYLHDDPTVVWIRLRPTTLRTDDLSYRSSPPPAP